MGYLKPSIRKCGGIFDKKAIQESISELQLKTTQPNFWDDNQSAQKILKNISVFENDLKMWQDLEEHYQEVESYLELLNEGEEVAEDADIALKSFEEFIEKVQIRKFLSDRDDHRNAILTIHPGAGGTESQDWANMLYRLYSRWCERNGYKIKILDYQDGDEAGIKDVSIEISGDYVYGNIKAERGVHRLVRISPFDSNSKRHTSFASVFIYPVIDDDVEINKDLFKSDSHLTFLEAMMHNDFENYLNDYFKKFDSSFFEKINYYDSTLSLDEVNFQLIDNIAI